MKSYTLPETDSSHLKNGCLKYYCNFLLAPGLFSGVNSLLVSTSQRSTFTTNSLFASQVLSNSLDPGEVTKEEVHYLQDKKGMESHDLWHDLMIQIN